MNDEKNDGFIENTEENFNRLLSLYVNKHVEMIKNASDAFKKGLLAIYNAGDLDKRLLKSILSALSATKVAMSFDVKYSMTDEELDSIIKDPDSHSFGASVRSVNPNESNFADEQIDKSKLH